MKKTKRLSDKAGVINLEEEEPPPSPDKDANLDPFNLSNDMYVFYFIYLFIYLLIFNVNKKVTNYTGLRYLNFKTSSVLFGESYP